MTNYLVDGFKIVNEEGQEEVINIPYNINNVLVTEQDILDILSNHSVKLDKINQIKHFYEAFTNKSYCKRTIIPDKVLETCKLELNYPNLVELQDKCYERLEYLGDRVLKTAIGMYVYNRYPKQFEGFMTKLQSRLEDKKNFANWGRELGFGKFFIISKQLELNGGRQMNKIYEDVFEAFIGALFLSNGFEVCMHFITNLLETTIDYSDKLYCDTNYKHNLMLYFHQNVWGNPNHRLLREEGKGNQKKYIMGVEKPNLEIPSDINNLLDKSRYIGFGVASKKIEGEQKASKMALIHYNLLNKDQYTENDIYYPEIFDEIKTDSENADSSELFDDVDFIDLGGMEIKKSIKQEEKQEEKQEKTIKKRGRPRKNPEVIKPTKSVKLNFGELNPVKIDIKPDYYMVKFNNSEI